MIPKGFQMAGFRCGLKNKRKDIGLIVSDRECRIAGVVTQNNVRASSVDYSAAVVASGVAWGLVVNSGNANCCTGVQGERDTMRMAELLAAKMGRKPTEIAVASTGVIGSLLDMVKVEKGVEGAFQVLGNDPTPFKEAILTTDLVEKEASATLSNGAIVYGVCKGSGMMAPNMATMLAFIVTDANPGNADLQAILKRAADKSFNRMSVDTDTSTNDMVLLFANGASGEPADELELSTAIDDVSLSLAKQIAKDGEGATKLIEVTVRGAAGAEKIARSVADSPLVKTAMFGCDPNWGRIMMAAGKAGPPFEVNDVTLVITASGESHTLFEAGSPAAFDPQRVSAGLKSDLVQIDLTLGTSDEEATIYTCDFGYGYVRINAEYHT